MNTQELAGRIVIALSMHRDIRTMPSYILVRQVKEVLDKALAESKVPTQNKHPVKVPAVPAKVADRFCYGCWDTGWTDTGCPCPCGKPGVVP